MDNVQKAGLLFILGTPLLYFGPMIPIINTILGPLLYVFHNYGTLGYYGIPALLYIVVIGTVAQDVLRNNFSKIWVPVVTLAPIMGVIAYEIAKRQS